MPYSDSFDTLSRVSQSEQWQGESNKVLSAIADFVFY